MKRKAKGQRKIRPKRRINRIKLTPREERIVAGVVAGKSGSRAMIEAGANPTSHSYQERLKPGGDLWQAAIDELNRKGAGLDRAGLRVRQALDAKETKFFAHEGKVVDKRTVVAHRIRLDAADTVYKVNRVYPEPKHPPGGEEVQGPVVNVQINVVKGPGLPVRGDGKGSGEMTGLVIRRQPSGNGDDPR